MMLTEPAPAKMPPREAGSPLKRSPSLHVMAQFHKYDTGGKGHLTAGEVASVLMDLGYDDVDG
jgi:hypothetical protein